MKQREKRNIIIGILCCMVVFMSVGYAALQQVLNINGTANITGSWKIEITSISPKEINEGESVSEVIEDSKVAGSFVANLKKPTDAVEYTVTVENKGTIDAVLESITPEDYSNGDIKYTTGGKEECKYLNAGASCNFTIKVVYADTGVGQNPIPEGTEVSQTFTIKYVQETSNFDTMGQPGGDIDIEEEKESDFLVTSDGMLLSYRGTNPDVVVPAEVNSVKITSIAPYAFNKSDFVLLTFADGSQKAVITNDAQAETIREVGAQVGIEEYPREDVYTKLTSSDLKMTDDKAFLPHIIGNSGLITEVDDNKEFHHVSSLDLSQMLYLEEISYGAVYGYWGKSDECPNQVSGCGLGTLTSLKLPMDGVLTTIGSEAFTHNQLTGNITIPATVTKLGSESFQYNNLTSATILGDKTRFDSNWSNIFDTGVTRLPE